MNYPISITVLGHVCHDIFKKGKVLGGTASYLAVLAKAFGLKVSLITSFSKDFKFRSELEAVTDSLMVVPSNDTTVFQNIYDGNSRKQFILSKANDILTDFQFNSDIVFFAPIADEVDLNLISTIPLHCLKVATVQGWLRKWGENGIILPKIIKWKQLQGLDVIIFSEEDLPSYREQVAEIQLYIPIIVVTAAEKGAYLFTGNDPVTVPTTKVKVVDPTGAGDSFAFGFTWAYHVTKDPILSVQIGHKCAKSAITKKGIYIPSEKEVKSFRTLLSTP